MAGTIRGDGLTRLHKALYGFGADPGALDRTRGRFGQSPPLYTGSSNQSGTTTRSASPELPIDEQRRRQKDDEYFWRREKLLDERCASLPLHQFKAQKDVERKRIWFADPRTSKHEYRDFDHTFDDEAAEAVKKCWMEQGIWKDKWDKAPGQWTNIGWKHEEPLEIESESESDREAGSLPPAFNLFAPQAQMQPKLRRPKSNEERRRIAERNALRDREREASRPYHQFVYQMSKEREGIQENLPNGIETVAADINSRASENVKATWIKRGIWNERWGIIPGMFWKHEEPLEEVPSDPASVPTDGNREAGHVPVVHIFGPPSPVESKHQQVPDALSSSQRESLTGSHLAKSEADEATHAFPTSKPPRATAPSKQAKRSIKSPKAQGSQPSKKRTLEGTQLLLARQNLDTARSSKRSKISKSTENKRPRLQRLSASQDLSFGDLPSLLDQDTTESLPTTTRRRSRRLELLGPTRAQSPMETATRHRRKTIPQPSSKRQDAGDSQSTVLAKPKGISKTQRSSKTRTKAKA